MDACDLSIDEDQVSFTQAMEVVKKILRYLEDTKYYRSAYRRSNHLEVVDYLDLNSAGCVNSRKSILEYIFLLTGGAISWKTGKQFIIATSNKYT